MTNRVTAWLERRRTTPHPAGPTRIPIASTAEPVQVQACEPVNGYRILDEVVRLPVSTWRYTADPPGVRHLGPMAQDWWTAFGVGVNDRTICCVDTNGVAIVAIQALHRLLSDTQGELTALREEVTALRDQQAPAHAACGSPGGQRLHS